MIRLLFLVLALLGILTALGTVLARNLVHAALFLVAFFFLVACQFVLLEAEFLAAMQVLVYIGAVAIILMFGIMLTRNIQGDETTSGHWVGKLPAAAVALGLLAVLVVGTFGEAGTPARPAWGTRVARESVADSPRDLAIQDMGRAVGREMLSRFVVPFEVAGVLLTAALVGAIALARSDDPDQAGRSGAVPAIRGATTLAPDHATNGHAPPVLTGASPPVQLSPRPEVLPR